MFCQRQKQGINVLGHHFKERSQGLKKKAGELHHCWLFSLSLLLSPRVCLTQTLLQPRLNLLDKSPLISSMARTWSLWNANSPPDSLGRFSWPIVRRGCQDTIDSWGKNWSCIKSGTWASQLHSCLTLWVCCSLLEYIFMLSLINTAWLGVYMKPLTYRFW